MVEIATVDKAVVLQGARGKIVDRRMSHLMVEPIVPMPSQTFQKRRGCNMALGVVLAPKNKGLVVAS
jgi:hypothetical protein